MSPPNLYERQLRESLAQAGPEGFRAAHPEPFLIFLGLVGQLDAKINAEKTTVAVPDAKEIAITALVGRVFVVGGREGAAGPSVPVTLGRDSACDICIPEYSISKRHCEFILAGHISLRDNGSTNGTLVEGVKLAPKATVELHGGETLVLGRFAFRFHTPTSYGGG